MKIFHISDLHIGKKLCEANLSDDQVFILDEIVDRAAEERPAAVIIAGDVYDRSDPSADAVSIFSGFLTKLSAVVPDILMISGNHDSADRLSYGAPIMKKAGIHIAGTFDGVPPKVTLTDEYGPLNFYLLPFVRPAALRKFYPDLAADDYTGAVTACVEAAHVNAAERNVCVSHQFVTGAKTSESEELVVGGLENVSAAAYSPFDYTALGHIHRGQDMGPAGSPGARIRYSGTPLKYSFSEASDTKSISVVTIGAKTGPLADFSVATIPLTPLRDLVNLKGTYEDLMGEAAREAEAARQAYTRITLTDEEDIVNGLDRLHTVYKHLLKLDYERKASGAAAEAELQELEEKTPEQIFRDFYRAQRGLDLSDDAGAVVDEILKAAFEDDYS